jgi:uncharacterized protein YdeI (YjbR/CyaY-like superfamily)
VRIAGLNAVNNKITPSPQGEMLVKDAPRLEAIGRLAPDGWFRTTLVPQRSDETRLYLDRWMRAAAHVAAGDQVLVRLKIDRVSRELTMPAELRKELESNPQANAAWQALTPSRRREILSYLNFLKTPAALERNVHKLITELLKQ